MTTMETATMPTETRVRAAKKKAKPAAKKKTEKVKGILTLPSGRFEVSVFLGAFERIEDAISAREQGLALRESLKAAPAPAPKKKKARAAAN